ncbi:MAG: GAF domain-containing protein [Chitinophagaceae bacterium]|nr:GAF domain-containing protein [Rubrivivax sp.]
MSIPTTTFIRVVEVWVPDADRSLLEFGGGMYGAATRFGSLSRSMCFGRGEGLPGQAWELGHPVVLNQFEGSAFRRTQAAHAEGLTSGIALPVFDGDTLNAVVVIFCGDNDEQAGAIELWHNDPSVSKDMTLADGYYGRISNVFEFISRRTAFRKGTGLPGLAWESGLPVFMEDLGKGSRFLRADSAQKVGINRGFAIPCASAGNDAYVMAFLSALATPIVQRFETWLPDAANTHLLRREGFCEQVGSLDSSRFEDRVEAGAGAVGKAFATGVPTVSEAAADEPGGVGAGARAAGLKSVVALPVMNGGRCVAVVAWYF